MSLGGRDNQYIFFLFFRERENISKEVYTPFLQAAEARTNNAMFMCIWVHITCIHQYSGFFPFQAQENPISHPSLHQEETMWLVHITHGLWSDMTHVKFRLKLWKGLYYFPIVLPCYLVYWGSWNPEWQFGDYSPQKVIWG